MKKILIVLSIALTASLIVLSGCNTGYTPDSSLNYYEENGTYRVIELSEEVKHEEEYPLHSWSLKNYLSGVTFGVTVTEDFIPGSLFTDKVIAKAGVELLYDMLDVSDYPPLSNQYFACRYTNLITYNQMKIIGPFSFMMPMDSENRTCSVAVAEVDIYTVTYKDLSKKDGEVLGTGTFEVVLMTGESILSLRVL